MQTLQRTIAPQNISSSTELSIGETDNPHVDQTIMAALRPHMPGLRPGSQWQINQIEKAAVKKTDETMKNIRRIAQ